MSFDCRTVEACIEAVAAEIIKNEPLAGERWVKGNTAISAMRALLAGSHQEEGRTVMGDDEKCPECGEGPGHTLGCGTRSATCVLCERCQTFSPDRLCSFCRQLEFDPATGNWRMPPEPRTGLSEQAPLTYLLERTDRMRKVQRFEMLAAVVKKLGGYVHLSARELVDSFGLELSRHDDPTTGDIILRIGDAKPSPEHPAEIRQVAEDVLANKTRSHVAAAATLARYILGK